MFEETDAGIIALEYQSSLCTDDTDFVENVQFCVIHHIHS